MGCELSACLCDLLFSVAMLAQVSEPPSDMSKWKATPFVVRRSLVIEGGWLQTPWAVDSKSIGGSDFITLTMSDRMLASRWGRTCPIGLPWASAPSSPTRLCYEMRRSMSSSSKPKLTKTPWQMRARRAQHRHQCHRGLGPWVSQQHMSLTRSC